MHVENDTCRCPHCAAWRERFVRFRSERVARNLSQREIADLIKAPDGGAWLMPDGATISGRDVNEIERGRSRDWPLIIALAALLGIPAPGEI